MPKGVPYIKHLYQTLRSEDADCLDLSSVIDLLKDMDKRLESLAARLDRSDPPVTKGKSKGA